MVSRLLVCLWLSPIGMLNSLLLFNGFSIKYKERISLAFITLLLIKVAMIPKKPITNFTSPPTLGESDNVKSCKLVNDDIPSHEIVISIKQVGLLFCPRLPNVVCHISFNLHGFSLPVRPFTITQKLINRLFFPEL